MTGCDSEGVISTRSRSYVVDDRRGRCVAWVVVKKLEADVGEIVFGGLLGTDPVGTMKRVDSVAVGFGATVVTLKRDANFHL